MLYQIGPLGLDTRPFSADAMTRSGGADLATKALMNTLQGREFMGEADEKITITGQLLPTKIGGMTELEMAHGLSRSGTVVPVMRGDGKMFGWFVIESVSEQHADLSRYGVGFTVKYSLDLVKVKTDQSASAGGSAGIVGMLLSLFEAL
jgi:phage protein U